MGLQVNRPGEKINKSDKITIGTPADGSWADGYFDTWTKDTVLVEALDDISEALDVVTDDIGTINESINTINEDINTIEEDVQSLVEDTGTLKQDVTDIKQAITDIPTMKEDISDIKEDIVNLKKLGLPTDESFEDGYFDTWTEETSIVDAIDDISEKILDIDGKIEDLIQPDGDIDLSIGTPSDSSWTDGFFDNWQSTTLIKDALDDISEMFKELAPSKAGVLTGNNLTGNLTAYTAKLSSGLDAKWYEGGRTPGSTISNYVINSSGLVLTPPLFRCGKKLTPTSYGILSVYKDGVVYSEYDMSNGVGNNSIITIVAIDIFNTFWARGQARANITLAELGHTSYYFKHGEAGQSNTYDIWFDQGSKDLSYSTPLTVSIENKQSWYLSGKEYLGMGTQIRVSGIVATGLFDKAYHATQVASITCTAVSGTRQLNPSGTPTWSDPFIINELLTINMATANNSPVSNIQLYRPEKNTSTSVNISGKICSYGVVSTLTADDFYDEDKRLVLDSDVAWTPSAVLQSGNAQVRNGSLQYTDVTDYPGRFGEQEYQRKITKASAATGSLTLTGLTYTNIAPYGTGNVNILLKLDGTNKTFDLGLAVGFNNGNGSGDSKENSIGCRVNGSGTTVNWSFGLNSTSGLNNSQYRIIIIFRNSNFSITKLVSA